MPVEAVAISMKLVVGSIPPPPITMVSIGPLQVHVFGIVVAVAVYVGWTVTRRRYRRSGGDPDAFDRVLVAAVVAGFAGARLGYVATNLDRYQGQWLDVLMVRQGGLALFGGLIVGTGVAIVVLFVARRRDRQEPLSVEAEASRVEAGPTVAAGHSATEQGQP
jgi:prolipoprotein diacylglyceryltransferase